MPEEVTRRRRDAAIASVAARQHGVISVQQLKEVGLPSSGVGDRVTAGRLHRIHRGVYAVGHPNIGNEGRWMAAVLACGEHAVLSHRSAAHLWRMLPERRRDDAGDSVIIHVTVSGEGKDRPGIRVHRSSTISAADCTRLAGIPVTRAFRTLVDLRRTVPSQVFSAALRQAEFLGLPLGDQMTTDHTRSELESRFLSLVRRHRLPQPEVNVRLGGFIVDFAWRSERLVVELDGWEAHRTRSAFESDRARDTRLRVLGFEVLRFTWRQMSEDPKRVAGAVRLLLGR
jgi:very-short-patch-repair endonuclease